MSDRPPAVFGKLSEERRNDIFWVGLLLGLVPALRADLLFPFSWFGGLTSRYALPTVENPFGPVAGVLALLLAGVALGSRRGLRALAAVPFVALLLADSGFGASLAGLNTVYLVSAFIVFVYFALRGEALSLPFVVFMTLLVVWERFDDLLSLPQVVVFLAATLASRFVVEAVRQNLPLARDLGRSNLLSLTGRTLSLWWPMLILIAIGMWFSAQITDATERLMYERGYVVPYCALDPAEAQSAVPCPEGERVLRSDEFYREPMPDVAEGDEYRQTCRLREQRFEELAPPGHRFLCPDGEAGDAWPLAELAFFDSLDLTVQRRYEVAGWELQQMLRSIDAAALKADKRAGTEARRLFSIVPKTTGMEPSPCYDPPWLDCEAANMVIRGLNSAYGKGRARAESRFVNYIDERAGEASSNARTLTADVRDSLTAELDAAETSTRQAIERVRSASNVVRQILLLWLVVAATKSILYVFARVIFDKSTDIDVDLLEPDSVPAEGTVRHATEVNIPGDYPYDIYYKANYQPLGPAARFSIPQWRASVMSRLRFGAWNMSRVEMPLDDPDGVTFNSIEAEHLIDWEMAEGEEVVFSYRNFVAMNVNVQLRTVISLRVATLLLGRIVFHTARCSGGPGRLILRTRGKPATAEQVRRSIPAARLVAWNRYARFSVDSHLTLADVFLNGFNLRRSQSGSEAEPQGILIVESDARDGGLLVGTMRFAKNFLMPV
ncbi:MAG: hypothetical protein RIC56_23800 [Pseudomonadales bacterium]